MDNTLYCVSLNPDFSETVAYKNPLFPAYIRHAFLSPPPTTPPSDIGIRTWSLLSSTKAA